MEDLDKCQEEPKLFILAPTTRQKKRWIKKTLNALCSKKRSKKSYYKVHLIFSILQQKIYEDRKYALWEHDNEALAVYDKALKEYNDLVVKINK